MKKILFIIVCLMAMVVSVNAQNGWISTSFEADDLTEQEAYTSLMYTTDNGSVVLWDNNEKDFRIVTNGVFDSEVGTNGWSMKKRSMFKAIIGIYNIDNKLLFKKKCYFEIEKDNHHQAKSIRYQMGKYEGGNIISFIRNEKGYVRIVAPLYQSNINFDIKVPCLNN